MFAAIGKVIADVVTALLIRSLTIFLIYVVAATFIWHHNNPAADSSTFYTHFKDVMKLNKLEKFKAEK